MADVSARSLLEGSTPKGQWRSVSRNIHKISDRVGGLIPHLALPWEISLDLLELIASFLGDGRYDKWVRSDSPALIMRGTKDRVISYKRGSLADKLRQEMELLNLQTKEILAEGHSGAPLRAAAFFHLKFVNIHPLKDGNGRTGRAILAAQCAKAYNIPVTEIIRDIEDFQKNYQRIFSVEKESLRFGLLLELLGLVSGVKLSKDSFSLPFPTNVAYPDLSPLPELSTIGMQKDEHGGLWVGVGVENAKIKGVP